MKDLVKPIYRKAVERLEELADLQRDRVLNLVAKEKQHLLSSVSLTTATNQVFDDYRQLLMDLQKIRFDLGLDEFRGPLPATTVRGASQSMTAPDGTNIQKHVFEAVTTVEQIFDARRIPRLVASSDR